MSVFWYFLVLTDLLQFLNFFFPIYNAADWKGVATDS